MEVVYAYTIFVDSDQVFYGVDAYPSDDLKNHSTAGSLLGSQDQDDQDVRRISELIIEVLNDGKPRVSRPYEDEYGNWKTAIAAIYDSNSRIVGAIAIDASLKFIHEEQRRLVLSLIFSTLLLLAIAAVIAVLLSRKITRPIIKLDQAIQQIGDGKFEFEVDIQTGDEIQDLAEAFADINERLKSYIKNLNETTAAKERIESELKIARSIQASMLPRLFPPFPERGEINIFATMEPAKEVGGDFYDYFFIDKNRLFICIADVSDKGVPAALFMVITKTL